MGQKHTYGALGRTDMQWFDPNDVIIVTDPKHTLYDERAKMPIDDFMVQSIMSVGVLEPVLARANGQDENGKWIVEVMDGRQRTRNCRVANERLLKLGKEPQRLPVILKRVDGDIAEDLMNILNEHRTQDGPLVRARKMQRKLDRGASMEEVMMIFKIKSPATYHGLLTLLDLHEDVQKEVESGVIGVGLAKQLAVFPREQQVEQLAIVKAAGNAAALGKSNGTTSTNGTNGHALDPIAAEIQALVGPPDPRLTAPDDEESGQPVPLAEHTAPVNPPVGKRGAKKAARAALKAQMGKRGGKIRARSVKTVAQLKEAREALKGSRSDVAPAFDAAIMWMLGEEDALEGYKHIAERLKGI